MYNIYRSYISHKPKRYVESKNTHTTSDRRHHTHEDHTQTPWDHTTLCEEVSHQDMNIQDKQDGSYYKPCLNMTRPRTIVHVPGTRKNYHGNVPTCRNQSGNVPTCRNQTGNVLKGKNYLGTTIFITIMSNILQLWTIEQSRK